LIAIHAAMVDEALCPVCVSVLLKYFDSCDGAFLLDPFADA
jgi:hypothetical protein